MATFSVAGILGRDGSYRDPMWEIDVRLTSLEMRLLRTWELRRLQFVAHAGASTLTTHQTYTRLEHTLGLFALAAHFDPDDLVARAAALLHDIGTCRSVTPARASPDLITTGSVSSGRWACGPCWPSTEWTSTRCSPSSPAIARQSCGPGRPGVA